MALLLLADRADARTLLVGADRDYKLPSEALAAAHDGDTVSIAPGEYFDCAIVRANGLTIQGEAPDRKSAMTDKVCEEKAILVLRGDATTVRNMTLQRARVPDGNGAGIRLEAPNLTIDQVHFDNDQVGILSGVGGGRITITDSRFSRGGVGGVQPKYAVMVGHSDVLRVAGNTFDGVKGGQITTAAGRSEIVGNTLGLGAGDAEEDPSYAVLATDGALLIQDNVMTVGPLAPRAGAAVGVWDDAAAVVRDNRMINQTGQSMALLKDWTWGDPTLQGNTIGPGDRLVTSSGVWRHRASSQYYTRKAQARALASQAKQLVKHVLGR